MWNRVSLPSLELDRFCLFSKIVQGLLICRNSRNVSLDIWGRYAQRNFKIIWSLINRYRSQSTDYDAESITVILLWLHIFCSIMLFFYNIWGDLLGYYKYNTNFWCKNVIIFIQCYKIETRHQKNTQKRGARAKTTKTEKGTKSYYTIRI